MSGWIIFTVCFTTLLVGTWSAFTVLEFYRAEKRLRGAELRPDPRASARQPRALNRRGR